jgi:PPK2 family polyphosphate:nucleotide phosphotransferase
MDLSPYRVVDGEGFRLADRPTDAAGEWTKEAAKDCTAELNSRLRDLQELLWVQRQHRVLVVLQAMDTGGKDGTIRNVFAGVNPSGVRVASFSRPTEPELARDFLWRVHQHVPADGDLVIFNRSHYEDVLVVRVFDLVAERRWRARFRHIVDFEQMLSDEGTTVVKLFLHVSADEQRERLQKRLDDPTKNWKFDPSDLEARARWDDFQVAFEDAISRTARPWAPWYVIPADRKWFRNLVVSEILVQTLDALGLAPPPANPDLDDVVID